MPGGLEAIPIYERIPEALEFYASETAETDIEPENRALFLASQDQKKQKMVTPVDDLTGLPLPIMPPEELSRFENDWHHHFHPKKSNLLKGYGGIAVRNCRIQYIPDIEIHDRYHSLYEGPPLPETAEEKFKTSVLACAGYIPKEAIDLHGDEPKVVTMPQDVRDRLWSSGEMRVASYGVVQQFLTRYVVKQDLTHVSESIIEEFLTSRSIERKRFLGHWLLALATEKASEPVEFTYKRAHQEGLIMPGITSKLPSFVKKQIGTRKNRDKAVRQLRNQLARSVA